MPKLVDPKVLSWASIVDDVTIEQARRTARLPVVAGHVALMPDAHLGKGATIGSVIPTEGAIIPSAVGVDLGCGMIAVRTTITAPQLPDDLRGVLEAIERTVPAGMGKAHDLEHPAARAWLARNPAPVDLSASEERKVLTQFGTLGGGNHFFEVCLDQDDRTWVVMHSGSRGIGNQLASRSIETAKRIFRDSRPPLEDIELAYFEQGTPEFGRYVGVMLWAQRYAFANRAAMMDAALGEILRLVGTGREEERVNCHHNFAARERHFGRDLWITRKGAIRAERGDLGVIPGAMGGKSYIVRGLGNPDSYRSCAHGAGRAMSRTAARKTITLAEFEEMMGDRTWLSASAADLIDEAPGAYKDIDRVMADQADLVEVVHELRGIVNFKGIDPPRSRRPRRRRR
jgi:RNA-splicing ligase RtcB